MCALILQIGTLLLPNNGMDVLHANIVCCICALAGDRRCLMAVIEEGADEECKDVPTTGVWERDISNVNDPFSALSSASER